MTLIFEILKAAAWGGGVVVGLVVLLAIIAAVWLAIDQANGDNPFQ